MRTEVEVDEMIEKMARRTKGKYITQGVSFNKDCPRQMRMLKSALMSSASFSGLIKELLAVSEENHQPITIENTKVISFQPDTPKIQVNEPPKTRDVGNFI